jgi:hypothetical protein
MYVLTKETLLKGRPATIRCLEINGQIYTVSKGLATTAQLEDEWYEDVKDPRAVIAALNDSPIKVDIFTFWQRLPEVQPKFDFYTEWQLIAALPITSFDYWWNNQIKSRTRSLIRKTKKEGLILREVPFDDAFVQGITDIFNETPVRQGRHFWHYGKDFETVKRQFSRYLFREQMIGAYLQDELIGFVMLGDAGRYAVTGQVLSKLRYRGLAPNNALISKAVEVCARRGFPYLVYFHWTSGSLSEFKRRCGFVETAIPRYYVPLTKWGRFALSTRLHRGWKESVPESIKQRLRKARSIWLGLKSQ